MKIKYLAPQSGESCSNREAAVYYCSQLNNVVDSMAIREPWQCDVEWGFGDRCNIFGANYKFSVEGVNVPDSCFSVSSNKIVSPGDDGSYNLDVDFNPASLENFNQFGVRQAQYRVQLLKNGNVIAESPQVCGINYKLQSNCKNCLEYNYISIHEVEGGVICSDNTIGERVKVAELVIDSGLNPLNPQFNLCSLNIAITNGPNPVTYYFGENDILREGMQNEYTVMLPADGEVAVVPVFVDLHESYIPENGQPMPFKIDYRFSYSICRNKTTGARTSSLEVPVCIADDFVRLKVELREKNLQGFPITSLIQPGPGIENQMQDVRLINAPGAVVVKRVVIANAASAANINRSLRLKVQKVTVKCLNSPDDMMRISGYDSENPGQWSDIEQKINEEFVLDKGGNIRFDLPFDFDRIGNIAVKDNCRFVELDLELAFNYNEERCQNSVDGNNIPIINVVGKPKQFKAILKVKIYRKDPLLWHSLDYGTSAVVACVMNMGTNNSIEVLNLKVAKNKLLRDNYPSNSIEDRSKREDFSEPTDNLISSMVYLNPAVKDIAEGIAEPVNGAEGQRRKFKDLPMWLSPASGMVNEAFRLPCLKNMMGHKNIPSITSISGNVMKKLSSIKVDDIMKHSYDQLFNYYINRNDVEALVLTIPNTFTPAHVDQLKEVVLENFPSLQEDMLEFVSESDSVLCSYVEWKRRQNGLQQGEERVLVYDMGAGTLDLTYALCNYTDNGCRMEILRKMGVNKAGNYVDYLLGEILCNLLKGEWADIFRDLLSYKPMYTEAELMMRKSLKDYLRNTVKIMLNGDQNAVLPALEFKDGRRCDELKNISVKDVVDHKLYRSYIGSCTADVLVDLFAGIDNNRVDVVLLSGRSVSLRGVVQSLERYLSVATSSNNTQYLDMSVNTGYTLKTIVAKGALDYKRMNSYSRAFNISKRKFYGCYGLLLESNAVPQEWIPLIDMNTRPLDLRVPSEMYEYEQEIEINVGQTEKVYLCHSYGKDTIADIRNGNFDVISRLHEYSPHTRQVRHDMDSVVARLKINSKNQLEYAIGALDKVTDLYPRDDYKNESLRKSLWPVVYK